jgi:hypothetical protein
MENTQEVYVPLPPVASADRTRDVPVKDEMMPST